MAVRSRFEGCEMVRLAPKDRSMWCGFLQSVWENNQLQIKRKESTQTSLRRCKP